MVFKIKGISLLLKVRILGVLTVGQESGIFEVQFFVGSSVVKCPACV